MYAHRVAHHEKREMGKGCSVGAKSWLNRRESIWSFVVTVDAHQALSILDGWKNEF